MSSAVSYGWRLLLLLAFIVQCTLVQSHVHPAEAAASSEAAASLSADQARHLANGTHIVAAHLCPLCFEQAMAGHYVQPSLDLALPSPAPELWIAARAMDELGLRPLSHAWRSRAPPE